MNQNAFDIQKQAYPRTRVTVKMEKLLVIWMTDLHQRKFPVGMKMTQTKALILYESVKKNLENKTEKEIDETFSASNGRFHKFLSRTGIKNINLKGEARSADEKAAKNYPLEFRKIIEEGGYTEDQIYNVDETALFIKQNIHS